MRRAARSRDTTWTPPGRASAPHPTARSSPRCRSAASRPQEQRTPPRNGRRALAVRPAPARRKPPAVRVCVRARRPRQSTAECGRRMLTRKPLLWPGGGWVNLRILFVEDSADDVALMLRRLREAGIEPQWERVQTEAALREALAGERWELALVDYNLPGFGGLEALAVLAAEAPDVPAITVSGAITEEMAVATITAGAVDYVLKDNLTRLAPAVRRAVQGAELRRQQRRAAEQARPTTASGESRPRKPSARRSGAGARRSTRHAGANCGAPPPSIPSSTPKPRCASPAGRSA